MEYLDCMAAGAADERPEQPGDAALRLAEANINPTTGLATDYLNHFIEAIMLLDMLSDNPEFHDDFLRWRPMSYREHFAASHFKTRDMAISAYESAKLDLRGGLDALTATMTAVLEATRAALHTDLPRAAAAALANEVATALKPLVARAGAIINGAAYLDDTRAPQAVVDDLMNA